MNQQYAIFQANAFSSRHCECRCRWRCSIFIEARFFNANSRFYAKYWKPHKICFVRLSIGDQIQQNVWPKLALVRLLMPFHQYGQSTPCRHKNTTQLSQCMAEKKYAKTMIEIASDNNRNNCISHLGITMEWWCVCEHCPLCRITVKWYAKKHKLFPIRNWLLVSVFYLSITTLFELNACILISYLCI